MTLKVKKEISIWIAKSLFDRGKASGSSANMSFRHRQLIYVTGSGTCFGCLKENDFSELTLEGKHIQGIKPSKEFPMHLMFYKHYPEIEAVLHVHSPYATLWSCLPHENEKDTVPRYTPYLEMKLGKVPLIPYAPPGSKELFQSVDERINFGQGFLMQNHGLVVGGKSLMDAFYIAEEMEESMKIAWMMKDVKNVLKIE